MDKRTETYENGRDIRDRAFQFARRTLKLCERLHGIGGIGRVLAPQLVRCSTSIPAMLEEARAAETRRDFISKCSIGLKECRESLVRLRLLNACHLGDLDETRALIQEALELVKILGAIVRNTRRHSSPAPNS